MATIGVIHGLGGTGRDHAAAGRRCSRRRGHQVQVVTLPGHGTDPDDLVGVGWSDWLAAVPHAEVLVGQSMGAIAGAHRRRREPPRAARWWPSTRRWPTRTRSRACSGAGPAATTGSTGPSCAEGEAGYTRLPITALIEMVEGVHAHRPRRGHRAGAAGAAARTTTSPTRCRPTSSPRTWAARSCVCVLPNSGHVATLGPDLPLLVAAIDEALPTSSPTPADIRWNRSWGSRLGTR